METRITFNGRTYDSPQSMPPDVREQYQAVLNALGSDDRAKVESRLVGGGGIRINTTVHRTIRVNGKDYDSADQLPPELREAYQRAVGRAAGGLPSSVDPAALRAPTDGEDSSTGTMWRAALFAAMAAIVIAWLLFRH